MRKCPYCAEEIQDDAIKCRYCSSNVEDFGRESIAGVPNIYPPFEVIECAPRRIKQWLKIKPGLNQSEVKYVLATPLDIVSKDRLNYWIYEDGNVHFDSENKTVNQWDFIVNDRRSDYRMWSELKESMSQLQVVAIVGNPDNVEISNNFCDDEDWEEIWSYYAFERDVIKSCIIRFSYLTKQMMRMKQDENTREEIQKKGEEVRTSLTKKK